MRLTRPTSLFFAVVLLASSARADCVLTCTATAPAQARVGEPVQFRATADFSSPTGGFCPFVFPTIQWTFHDGTAGPQNSVKTYPVAGTFPWSMTASVSNLTCTKAGTIVITPVTPPPASVIVIDLPDAMVQAVNGIAATTSFTVQNVGGTTTEVTLTRTGNFFTQTPNQFTLAPRATQVVTVSAMMTAAGAFEGASLLSGLGVPAGLSVPIRLLTNAPPAELVRAVAGENRVDIVSQAGGSPTGTTTFINRGNGPLLGALSADALWIVPQTAPVAIAPGQSSTVMFAIDPARRVDGEYGAATGNLILTFLSGGTAKAGSDSSPGAASASVPVVHTVSPGASPGQIPAFGPGEIGLFLPGIAHAPGSVGTFLSDLSLTSLAHVGSLSGVRLYFTPRGSTATLASTINQITANRPLFFGDVARTLFGNTTSVGTLQVRSPGISNISASANVFNISNSQGTYGTTIPVFRSDRSAAAGEKIFLTGLRANATTHTNLYIQETAGQNATAVIDFYDANGTPRGTRNEALGPFALLQLGTVVPDGVVSAILTNAAGSAGRLAAYATPVDRASGDTWAVADWRRQYGATSGAVVVPVAASVRGANNTFFRTDIAMLNTGPGSATGTLRFFSRTGETVDRPVNLAALRSLIVVDVLTTMFNLTGDHVGSLLYVPTAGNVAITSRTYTTVEGQSATFGTGVPTVPLEAGLRAGQIRRLGGMDDSALATINAARGGTFRTNIGFVEILGQPVTVRATLRFTAGTQASAAQAIVTKDYAIGARQFLQINGISREMIPNRDTLFGDLRNMQLDLQVLSGDGAMVFYSSSVDNGTGDSLLRID